MEDHAKISQFPLLDFYIKLILCDHKQVFLLTDYSANAIFITQEHLDSVEQLMVFEYEDMLKLNLSKLVSELASELFFELD